MIEWQPLYDLPQAEKWYLPEPAVDIADRQGYPPKRTDVILSWRRRNITWWTLPFEETAECGVEEVKIQKVYSPTLPALGRGPIYISEMAGWESNENLLPANPATRTSSNPYHATLVLHGQSNSKHACVCPRHPTDFITIQWQLPFTNSMKWDPTPGIGREM